MQTENGQPITRSSDWKTGNWKSELLGSSVFDRNNYLMGQVVSIDEDAGGRFSLAIAPSHSNANQGHFSIDGSLLTNVDPLQREIYTSFDYDTLMSNKEQCFQLLEERLVLNRKRVKLGEVVIRKVTETRMVEVPVHREKLVVQTLGDEQSLFEMPLGETHLHSDDSNILLGSDEATGYRARGHLQSLQDAVRCLAVLARSENWDCRRIRATLFLLRHDRNDQEAVQMEFETPNTATNLLGAIAPSWSHVCRGVGLELLVADETAQHRYQSWFDEYARVIGR